MGVHGTRRKMNRKRGQWKEKSERKRRKFTEKRPGTDLDAKKKRVFAHP